MKKIFIKFLALIMIVVLATSFAGCSLFETTIDKVINDSGSGSENNNNENNNGGNENEGTNPGGGAIVVPGIDDISNKPQFGILGNRVEKKKTEVISSVRGAVVAIIAETSAGSGVIVDLNLVDVNGVTIDNQNEFYILTCHHVIDGEGDITVYLPDAEMDNVGESDYDSQNYAFKGKIGESEGAVELIGGDQKSDVALLKVTITNNEVAKTVVKVPFAPADYQMMVGEEVIAIGNPGGDLPGTVSVGTISYINRETTVGGIGNLSLTQINVDIYHGSSGGGLFNMYGEIIGITNAGRDGTANSDGSVESYSGLNFAIPYVVNAGNGADDYGFMSVAGQLLITKTADNYGYVPGRTVMFGFTTTQQANSQTVQVTDVTENSLAYGKLRVGDVILKVVKGDKSALDSASAVTSNSQVTAVFKTIKAGDKVSLLVSRQNREVAVEMNAVQYIFCDTGVYA